MEQLLEKLGSTSFTSVVVAAGLLLLTLLWFRWLGYGYSRLPPGSFGLPIWSDDAWRLFRECDFMLKKNLEEGPICKGVMLGQRVVYVSDTSEIKRLLAAEHDLVEASWPPSMYDLLGRKSIGASSFDAHKKLRRAFNPAFTAKAIREYLPRIQQLAEQFARNMTEMRPALAHVQLQYFAFQVVAELVLGFDESWFSGESGEQIRDAWKEFTAAVISLPINFPGTTYRRGLQARRFLLGRIGKSLELVKKELDSMLQDAPKRIAHNLLEAREDNGAPLSSEQLHDICINILWAGHDTTATSMVQLMRLLVKHPEVMQKLRDEQAKVMSMYGPTITEAALRDMPYAEAVMKENLRLYQVVPAVPRQAVKSFTVGNKYTVPKGWQLWLVTGRNMLDDPTWEAADDSLASSRFNPDRWLQMETKSTPAFLPFGAGARTCLGYPLAKTEIKVMIATLARGYAWEVEDPDEEWCFFPIKVPKKGLPLRFHPVQ